MPKASKSAKKVLKTALEEHKADFRLPANPSRKFGKKVKKYSDTPRVFRKEAFIELPNPSPALYPITSEI